MNAERGKQIDELEDVELVVELEGTEDASTIEVTEIEEAAEDPDNGTKEEVRLNREQTLQDLRELQELTVERASGRTSDPDG